ncbi:MAG: PEP-CTERM sorting domain-containing protein [Cyanobacteriota bacterium]|nr:PEP-CTERM sorting domain-containing protein [Cyanobacteriota bacterium]
MKKLSVVVATAAVLASALMSAAPAKAAQLTGRQVIDFSGRNRSYNNANGVYLEGDYKHGSIITGDEWVEQGLKINVDTNRKDSDIPDSERLTLYNTSKQNGKDPDLRTHKKSNGQRVDTWGIEEYRGNALIIQETYKENNHIKRNDGRYTTPDDDAAGGTITFDFLSADVDYIYEDLNIGLLDIDGPESAEITVYYKDRKGERRQVTESLWSEGYRDNDNITLLSNNIGDNSLWNFNFDIDRVVDGTNLERRDWSLDKVEVKYTGSGAVAYLDYNRFEKEGYGEVEVPEPGSVIALLALGAFGGHSVLKRKKH